jgi:hypothetical protein
MAHPIPMPKSAHSATEPDPIALRIMVLRGQRVLLDADLARIYGVTTKRLNEQVKRNLQRFPEEFVFQLSEEEKAEVVAKCDHLRKLRFSPNLPYAFTEHGAIQSANVLNSEAAIAMGVHIVRAFVGLSQWLGTQKALAAKLAELEARVGSHDEQLLGIIEALRHLTASPEPTHGRRIGFHRPET